MKPMHATSITHSDKLKLYQWRQQEREKRLRRYSMSSVTVSHSINPSSSTETQEVFALAPSSIERERIRAQLANLKSEKAELLGILNELNSDYTSLRMDYEALYGKHDQHNQQLAEENNKLKEQLIELEKKNRQNNSLTSPISQAPSTTQQFVSAESVSTTTAPYQDHCTSPMVSTLSIINNNFTHSSHAIVDESIIHEIQKLRVENATLRSQLTEEMHRVEVLSAEVQTVPDYIQIYHKERSLLQKKAKEKETMIAERDEMIGKLKDLVCELQKIIRELDGKKREDLEEKYRALLKNEAMNVDFTKTCPNCSGYIVQV